MDPRRQFNSRYQHDDFNDMHGHDRPAAFGFGPTSDPFSRGAWSQGMRGNGMFSSPFSDQAAGPGGFQPYGHGRSGTSGPFSGPSDGLLGLQPFCFSRPTTSGAFFGGPQSSFNPFLRLRRSGQPGYDFDGSFGDEGFLGPAPPTPSPNIFHEYRRDRAMSDAFGNSRPTPGDFFGADRRMFGVPGQNYGMDGGPAFGPGSGRRMGDGPAFGSGMRMGGGTDFGGSRPSPLGGRPSSSRLSREMGFDGSHSDGDIDDDGYGSDGEYERMCSAPRHFFGNPNPFRR